jgi:BlaI family penicillinase repressor
VTPARRNPARPERAILQVRWARGPSTGSTVALAPGTERFGTAVLKWLRILAGKRLVERDESARRHVHAASGAEETERQIVGDLLSRVFTGSASVLMVRAPSVLRVSPAGVAAFCKPIDRPRGGRR